MKARWVSLFLVVLALTSVFSRFGPLSPVPAAAQPSPGGVGDYYAVLVLEGLPDLDFNEEEISTDGQWVIAGSLNPTTSNPFYLLHINVSDTTSPSVIGVTDLTSEAAVEAAQATYGVQLGGSGTTPTSEPSVGQCGTSEPQGANSSGVVVGTTYYSPPGGGPLVDNCGAFIYRRADRD